MFVLFRLRGKKLYCRVTISSERANCDFSTHITCRPDVWDQQAQRCTGHLAEVVNRQLAEITATLHDIASMIRMQGREVTAQRVKEMFLRPASHSIRMADMYDRYIAAQQREGLHKRTIQARENAKKLMSSFIAAHYSGVLFVSEVNMSTAGAFWAWLAGQGYGNDYCVRQLEIFKAVMRQAVNERVVDASPIETFKKPRKPVAVPVFLTSEEIEVLRHHNFSVPTLRRVADIFLFQCFTGMDYGDLMSFDYQAHVQEVEGSLWIVRQRQKGGTWYELPLQGRALMLLRKYDYALPHISNAKFNFYLKEVALLCEIPKKLTTHIGRKTFGWHAINVLGISYEALSKMMGHTSTRVTETYYAKVDRRRLIMELAGRFEGAAAPAQPDRVTSR